MATSAQATKVIRIDVIASAAAQANIKALAANMNQVTSNTNSMKQSMGGIGQIFSQLRSLALGAGIVGSFGAATKAVIETSNAFTVMEARMRLVLGTQESTTRAMTDMVRIATDTGREIDGVSKLYEKAARAGQTFGVNQNDVAKITEAFGNSIRLSGASTQEAYAALVQFGQALASGRLQGDEFRSLMENNAVFMYEFAKASGHTVAELRKMGTEGKLSAEMMFGTMLKMGPDGLNMLDRLNKMARDVPLTFRQSFQGVKTETFALIGELTKMLTPSDSGDQLGIFGPWIRSIRAFRQNLLSLREEAEAANDGWLTRLFTTLNAAMPQYTRELSPAERVRNRIDQAKQDVQEALRAQQEAMRLSKLPDSDPAVVRAYGGAARPSIDSTTEALNRQVKVLQDLEALQDRRAAAIGPQLPDEPSVIKPGAPPVDKDAERAAKKAKEALDAFILSVREQIEVEKLLAANMGMTNAQAKERVQFEKLMADAGVPLTGQLSKRIQGWMAEAAALEKVREEREEFEKARTKEFEAGEKRIETVQAEIDKDMAAIEAIRQRTKATRELSDAKIAQNLVYAQDKLAAMDAFNFTEEQIEQQRRLVAALQEQSRVRGTLKYEETIDKARKEQEKLDKEIEKGIDRDTKRLNRAIVDGIGEGNIAETLFDNIQDVMKSKVLELVISPITEPFAREMAEFAAEMGKMLSATIFDFLSGSRGLGGESALGGYGAALDMFLSANGNIMTPNGPLRLSRFAAGGIATEPMLSVFGEGRKNEAYVPLPDNRTIPVTLTGSNGDVYIDQKLEIGQGVSRAEVAAAIEASNSRLKADIQRSRNRGGAFAQ